MVNERRKNYGRRRYYGKKKSKKKKPNTYDADSTTYVPESVTSINYWEIDLYLNEVLDIKISKEDERLLLLGKQSWDESLNVYHNPAIPDPQFIFDKSNNIGFFIELDTWRTTMNLKNTPNLVLDKELKMYYFALALHEISHYVICPYDKITNARLIKAANSHLPERKSAIIVNFFSDLVIDLKNFKKFPKEMEFELRNTVSMSLNQGKDNDTQHHSKFWKILVKCYEIMWNIDLKLPDEIFTEIEPYAKRISKLILKDFENFSLWEKKVKTIASILKEILEEEFQTTTSFSSFQGPDGGLNGGGGLSGGVEVPKDVGTMMGNPLEIKTKIKEGPTEGDNGSGGKKTNKEKDEDQAIAETLAEEMNLKEFIQLNRVMGLVSSNQTIATYYRGISKNLISIKIFRNEPSGSIPVAIEPWRVGDLIEDLDILQTVLVSPKIIPNVTTRKWVYMEGPGKNFEMKIPDLLIVLDSSGSMDWEPYAKTKKNKSPYHLGLVASFAALHHAIKKGAKVAAINFSERIQMEEWTKDYKKIEKVLLSYQAMGTILPTKKIKVLCKKAERRSLILLITDFDIGNWESSFSDLVDILSMGNKLVGFFIGGSKNALKEKYFKLLVEMGAKFYIINKLDDMIGLVIKEVQEMYD